MSGYSLLGLSDPTQWGIGGKDNFLTRFGVAMNRGLSQGDATYNLLNKQRSTMARTPYENMAAIAKDRGNTAYWQDRTRALGAQERGNICLTAPNSYLCAQSRATAAPTPHVVVQDPLNPDRWASVAQSAATRGPDGNWMVGPNGVPPKALADNGDDLTAEINQRYLEEQANQDQQYSMGVL